MHFHLQGCPQEFIQQKGRWSAECFKKYIQLSLGGICDIQENLYNVPNTEWFPICGDAYGVSHDNQTLINLAQPYKHSFVGYFYSLMDSQPWFAG